MHAVPEPRSLSCASVYFLSSGRRWRSQVVSGSEAFGLFLSSLKHCDLLMHLFPEEVFARVSNMLKHIKTFRLERSDLFSELDLALGCLEVSELSQLHSL